MSLLAGNLLRRKSKSRNRRLSFRPLRLEPMERRELLTVVSIIPVKDTTIYSNPTGNSNGAGDIFVGLNNDKNRVRRGLMEFDVAAAVPAGATINSATLTMYCNRTQVSGQTIELHKVATEWGESTSSGKGSGGTAKGDDATWIYADLGQSVKWATAGGDFSSTVSASKAVSSSGASYTWASTTQLVADVQGWLNTPTSNHGWLLKGNETSRSAKRFDSRSSSTASRRPTLTIDYTAAATNQPPTLGALSALTINENASQQTVNLSGISAGSSETQALQVTATSDNTALIPNPTVTYTSPNATGSIAFTPVAYKYGTANVTVTVRDAGLDGTLGNSDDATTSRTFLVTVTHVNQTPTLDALNALTINENASQQTVNLAGISAGQGDSQTLQVTAASDNTTLVPNPTVTYTSANATGSIAFTPVAYKYGTAHVTVTVRDAGLNGTMGDSDDLTFARTFLVTVNQVNQTPTLGAISAVTINENAPQQTVNLVGISAGQGDSQTLQVTAASDNTALIPNPTVTYTSPNATGSIAFTPVAYAYGTANVTVTVRDAGLNGTMGDSDDLTYARTFLVTVNQVNQTPTLGAIGPLTINENAPQQTVNLAGISAGPGDSQTLQVTAASDNTALIPNPTVTYTTPNATGSIAFTPVADKYGTANVTVTVRDAGLNGTMGDSDDLTSARTFLVTVNQEVIVTLNPWKDNTLIQDAAGAVSNGLGEIYVGRTTNGMLQRGLLAFDVVGSIPEGAVIQSASLKLYMNKTQVTDRSISLHKLSADWGEAESYSSGGAGDAAQPGDATWLHTFYDTDFWATPGGDFASATSATQTVGAQGAYYNWASTPQMVADVQNWLDNPDSDFGWLLQGDETQNSSKRFSSREATDSAQAPVLTIDYVVAPANRTPTLDPIENPEAIYQDAVEQTVGLTGITAGPGDTQDLQVTATSDNPSLIPNPTVIYTSPDDDGSLAYTPVEGKSGTAKITVTVRDAGLDGILDNADDATFAQSFDVTVLPPVELGTVDFKQLAAQTPESGELYFRLEAKRDGILTALVDGAGVGADTGIEIYDATLSTGTSGVTRADFLHVAAGQAYLVRVSGLTDVANVTLVNLVGLNANATKATVYGTAGDDTFEAWASPASIVIDGISYASNVPSDVAFIGGGGNDVATLNGSAGADTVTLTPHAAAVIGVGYQAEITDVPTIRIRGGGGLDTAYLHDSSGADTLQADPGRVVLSGAGYSNRVTGFDAVYAYADAGGNDTANLNDSAGNDSFRAGPDFAVLKGSGFYHRAEKFDAVNAYARNGGHDVATFTGSNGDDTFIGTSAMSELLGTGFHNRAKFFDEVYAYGLGNAGDSAKIYDSTGTAHLDQKANTAKLNDAALAYLLFVQDFAQVYAKAPTTPGDTRTVTNPLDYDATYDGDWTDI